MSSHTGVSCDSCMKANFPGRRYKCLLCDNYDLCGACYDIEAESQNHKNDHPMQCILTETAYDIFYAGEAIPRRQVVSLTCPHCGVAGFIPRTLLTHCMENHSTANSQDKTSQVVMCPICVTSSSNGSRSRFVLLADHIAAVHDDGTMIHDDDAIQSSSISQTRRIEHEEEDSDEDDDDDDEAALNDLEHRAFIEEEHRRQEAARHRLAHASSLAAVIRNDYASALSGNANTQRRPLSRQTAIRGHRGGLRGHFHNYPYGVVPRLFTGYTSNTSIRPSSDSSTTNSTQNALSNDPYGTFAQDPMLEFVSRLVSNQSSSSSSSTTPNVSTSNGQFLFAPSIPVQVPSSTATAAELTRFQQQLDNGESMIQIKTTLLNGKQKRSSHNPTSTSSQPVMLNHSSGFDYELWQQQFPALQSAYNNLNFFTGNTSTDLTLGNSNHNNSSSSKHSQQSHREYDPRSLLGKIIRNEQGVNNGETNETHTSQQQDHIAYLQSILLSAMITNSNTD